MFEKDCLLLRTLKAKDFSLWLKLVDMYYKGYHTTVEGKYLFDAIKLYINKYRLTTNVNLLKDKELISMREIENLLSKLSLLASPYEVRQGLRYHRDTDKLVSEATKIVAVPPGPFRVLVDPTIPYYLGSRGITG